MLKVRIKRIILLNTISICICMYMFQCIHQINVIFFISVIYCRLYHCQGFQFACKETINNKKPSYLFLAPLYDLSVQESFVWRSQGRRDMVPSIFLPAGISPIRQTPETLSELGLQEILISGPFEVQNTEYPAGYKMCCENEKSLFTSHLLSIRPSRISSPSLFRLLLFPDQLGKRFFPQGKIIFSQNGYYLAEDCCSSLRKKFIFHSLSLPVR